MKKLILLTLLIGLFTFVEAQNTITLSPSKDNTLFSESGSLSNGAGQHLFVGRTNGGDLRRALVAFDIAGALQPGDSIISATIKLRVNRVNNNTSRSVLLHRVSADWGAGSSDATGQEGQGANAVNGDATWSNAFFGGAAWTNAGGDFDQIATEDFSLGGNGAYDVTGSNITQDVQDWFTNPASNFGWIMIGDESTNGSAKRISSGDNSSNPIALEITFTSPVSLAEGLTAEKVNILPNPVASTFLLSGISDFETIEIIDLSGKIRRTFTESQAVYEISDLERGIYLLRVSNENNQVTKKLVKN